MVIEPGTFSAAIHYVAEFGSPQTPVVFTPQGRSVRVSIAHHGRYAEYWVDSVEPLAERFAVSLFALPAIADELGDDRLEYRQGSCASFRAGHRVWRLNFCASSEDGRPDIAIQDSFQWDSSFSDYLALTRQATSPKRTKLAMDCVCAEWRSDRRSLVGANDSMITACIQMMETGYSGVSSILIDRSNVPLILATCKSGGAVQINKGLRHYSVSCGKRIAVFPMVDGRFAPVADHIRDARAVSRNKKYSKGSATIPTQRLLQCVRQSLILSDAVSFWSDGSRLLLSSRDDASASEVELDGHCHGEFGRASVRAAFIKGIANGWPSDSIQIQNPGTGLPLVFSTPGKDKSVVSVVMPMG